MTARVKTFGEGLVDSFREAMDIIHKNAPPAAHSTWEQNADGSMTRHHYKKGILVSKSMVVDGKVLKMPLH